LFFWLKGNNTGKGRNSNGSCHRKAAILNFGEVRNSENRTLVLLYGKLVITCSWKITRKKIRAKRYWRMKWSHLSQSIRLFCLGLNAGGRSYSQRLWNHSTTCLILREAWVICLEYWRFRVTRGTSQWSRHLERFGRNLASEGGQLLSWSSQLRKRGWNILTNWNGELFFSCLQRSVKLKFISSFQSWKRSCRWKIGACNWRSLASHH